MAVMTKAELEALKATAQANIKAFVEQGVRPQSHSVAGESYNYTNYLEDQKKIVEWCDQQIDQLEAGNGEFMAQGYTF